MTAQAAIPEPSLAPSVPRTAGGAWATFALDLRSVALFRVTLAGLVAAVFGLWGWRFVSTPGGAAVLSPLLLGQAAALGLLAVASVALFVGWVSRTAALLALAAMLAMHLIDPATLTQGTALLRFALLWATLLPLGDRYAVDSAIHGPAIAEPRIANIATLGVVLQLLSVHLDPSALGDHAELRSITPLARAIEQQPWWPAGYVWTEAIEALGFGLLIVGVAFSGGVRAAAVATMVLLHTVLGFALETGLLQFVLAALWLLLLPTGLWEALRRTVWTPDRVGVRLWHSDRDGTQITRVRLLRTFLLLPPGAARPTSEDIDMDVFRRQRDSWVVTDADGYRYVKFRALAAAFHASPIFWPLSLPMRIGFVEAIGDWLYDLTKRRRGPVVLLAERAQSTGSRPAHAIAAAVLLAAMMAWRLGLAQTDFIHARPELHATLTLLLGG